MAETLRSPAPLQPTELAVQVGPRPALASPDRDRVGESGEGTEEAGAVGTPPAATALLEPVDRAAVTPLGIAAPAGGDLVLQPGRATLQPRHHVFGRRRDQRAERPAAPDAGLPVTGDDRTQPGGTAGLRRHRHSDRGHVRNVEGPGSPISGWT